MKLVQLNAESLPHGQRHSGKQALPSRRQAASQSTPRSVVTSVRHLVGADAEQPSGELVNGFIQPI
jgi:hypothetical protein